MKPQNLIPGVTPEEPHHGGGGDWKFEKIPLQYENGGGGPRLAIQEWGHTRTILAEVTARWISNSEIILTQKDGSCCSIWWIGVTLGKIWRRKKAKS